MRVWCEWWGGCTPASPVQGEVDLEMLLTDGVRPGGIGGGAGTLEDLESLANAVGEGLEAPIYLSCFFLEGFNIHLSVYSRHCFVISL